MSVGGQFNAPQTPFSPNYYGDRRAARQNTMGNAYAQRPGQPPNPQQPSQVDALLQPPQANALQQPPQVNAPQQLEQITPSSNQFFNRSSRLTDDLPNAPVAGATSFGYDSPFSGGYGGGYGNPYMGGILSLLGGMGGYGPMMGGFGGYSPMMGGLGSLMSGMPNYPVPPSNFATSSPVNQNYGNSLGWQPNGLWNG